MSGEDFDFAASVSVQAFATISGLRAKSPESRAKTVWRWIKSGRVRAKKTPGGHWRVLLENKYPDKPSETRTNRDMAGIDSGVK